MNKKRLELEKLMTDIAESKIDISTLDDETKERLLKMAIRKVRMMRIQSFLITFREIVLVAAIIAILILLYRTYYILSGYFMPLTIP